MGRSGGLGDSDECVIMEVRASSGGDLLHRCAPASLVVFPPVSLGFGSRRREGSRVEAAGSLRLEQ